MDSGPFSWSVSTRLAIQSPSFHSCRLVTTFDAVAGGTSEEKANGSAFSRQTPSWPRIWNLYLVPTPTPGMKSSQTPDEPSERIGVPAPDQWSKSPVTRTPRALGAHTANEVPVTVPPGVS